MNLDTTKVPQLADANVFTNNQTIAGPVGQFGLTVSEPSDSRHSSDRARPAFIGAALEFRNHRNNGGIPPINGMYWQILNTGATSANQRINKLNFRNDSAGNRMS